jgi:predicted nucleic acid-binding protein
MVTLAEIRFGIELVAAPARSQLMDWLTHKVRPMFEQRALAVTEDIMFKWRLMVEEGGKSGHTFSQPDLIIAATGQYHGPHRRVARHCRILEGTRPCVQSLS